MAFLWFSLHSLLAPPPVAPPHHHDHDHDDHHHINIIIIMKMLMTARIVPLPRSRPAIAASVEAWGLSFDSIDAGQNENPDVNEGHVDIVIGAPGAVGGV